MKTLLVLSALIAVSCAASLNFSITVTANKDGSMGFSVPKVGSITLPASTVSTVENLAGVVNSVAAAVPAGTSKTFPVSVTQANGAYSITFNGKIYALNSAAIANIGSLVSQLTNIISG